MNFFQHQDDARKKTIQLIGLFALAILSLIAITSIFVTTFLYFFQSHATSVHAATSYNTSWTTHLRSLIYSKELIWVAGGVIFVVCTGALIKHLELKRGGSFVAESLGGVLLVEAKSETEKRLINIVEEMAIASGSSVPLIYLLEEDGINAFAAGNTCSNAVIGITRGAIETLDRSQLQGVVAHEFSHIQHGDMRLNMRLLALLNGIMVIGLIGEILARSGSRRRYSHNNKNRNQLAILGIGLIVIGFCGTFFGKIIKAAVSRQREFLADASAVQFTRNPDGIAGALSAIKRHSSNALIRAQNASQFSHFYFASGTHAFFSKLFSTHPPIETRIYRISKEHVSKMQADISDAEKFAPQGNVSPKESALAVNGNPQDILGMVGITAHALSLTEPSTKDSETHDFNRVENNRIQTYARDPYTARVIVFSLLLDKRKEHAEKQQQYLQSNLHPSSYREFKELSLLVAELPDSSKLALALKCCPALRELSTKQREAFIEHSEWLIKEDNKVSVREWSVLTLILSSFDETSGSEKKSLKSCKAHVISLLRFLSELNIPETQESAYFDALSQLWPRLPTQNTYPERPSLSEVNASIKYLKQVKPLEKPSLIKALTICSKHDGTISPNERIALKAIAASLNCPISLV